MKRGVVLFAHNSKATDYYKMAEFTAKRINHFLELPVTVITDSDSDGKSSVFDNTRLVVPDKSNTRNKAEWINKGRYLVHDLTPYEDTIVLDVDYLINSNQLLKLFDAPSDFVCAKDAIFMFQIPEIKRLSRTGPELLWATVMRFTKTKRTEQIFGMVKMVQENYAHYRNIYGFSDLMYRNDFAFTIALNTVNGHLTSHEDYMQWPLVHVDAPVKVSRDSYAGYTMKKEEMHYGKKKPVYVKLNDYDFHMLDKENFMGLINE